VDDHEKKTKFIIPSDRAQDYPNEGDLPAIHLRFWYKNHRGELSWREVHPIALDYILEPQYGYTAGWFLRAFDHQKNAVRSFKFENIMNGPGGKLVFGTSDHHH
jgi:hypothetical protein